MVTRYRVGSNRPTQRFTLNVSTISPIPKSYTHAFNDPNWFRVMLDEYNALIKNNTWILVPRPPDANIVRSMWLFRHKYNADGSLNRYKARLVANGGTQLILSSDHFMDLNKPLGLGSRASHYFFACGVLHDYLGPLNYFLGVSVTRNTSGMFLSQQKYATEVLDRASMLTCNPCRTPVDTNSKLVADGDPDPTLYRSLAGALQYLTFTRPDISYVVQQVCLFMHDPREPHFVALKRVLRYVRGTLAYGLQLYSSSTSSLVAYSDADWIFWTCRIRNLLRELYTPLSTATIVYCDNVSVVYLSSNPVQHQRTKHIEINIHFVRDLVASGHVRVLHVPSRYQYADIFTKGLPTALFDEFRSGLSVRFSPAQTAGGC
ncbi:ribonuclease H-like domain-containing protein [Tanacetum coccineum]